MDKKRQKQSRLGKYQLEIESYFDNIVKLLDKIGTGERITTVHIKNKKLCTLLKNKSLGESITKSNLCKGRRFNFFRVCPLMEIGKPNSKKDLI